MDICLLGRPEGLPEAAAAEKPAISNQNMDMIEATN